MHLHHSPTASTTSSESASSTNSPTSSSRSSTLYDLDSSSTTPILVYKHLSTKTYYSTQRDLCAELDGRVPPTALPKSSPEPTTSPTTSFRSAGAGSGTGSADPAPQRYRCARKPIPRGASRIDISARDALPPPARQVADERGLPSSTLALANVGLPRRVYWRRLLLGQFQELYILSAETGAPCSGGNSPTNTNAP